MWCFPQHDVARRVSSERGTVRIPNCALMMERPEGENSVVSVFVPCVVRCEWNAAALSAAHCPGLFWTSDVRGQGSVDGRSGVPKYVSHVQVPCPCPCGVASLRGVVSFNLGARFEEGL